MCILYFFDGSGSGVLGDLCCLLLSAADPVLGPSGALSCFFSVVCLLESSGGVSLARVLISGNLPVIMIKFYQQCKAKACHLHCGIYHSM